MEKFLKQYGPVAIIVLILYFVFFKKANKGAVAISGTEPLNDDPPFNGNGGVVPTNDGGDEVPINTGGGNVGLPDNPGFPGGGGTTTHSGTDVAVSAPIPWYQNPVNTTDTPSVTAASVTALTVNP